MPLQQDNLNPDLSLGSKLDRIPHQVVQHLLQPQLVSEQAVRQIVGDLKHQGNTLGSRPSLLGPEQLLDATAQAERCTLQFKFACLYLGDIKHVIDQRQQVLCVILDIGQIPQLLIIQVTHP